MGQKTRLIKGVNDLQTMRPDVAQYWHPTKNDIKPDEIYYMSTKEIWFLYPYDDPNTGKHYDFEWKQRLCKKVLHNTACPYLSKPVQKAYIYPGFNDLYTKQKELIDSEWDWDKNTILPSEIAEYSHLNVWWKCSAFGHSYQRPVSKKLIHKTCPICTETMYISFAEKAVYYYMKQVFPDAIPNYIGCFDNRMELDIYIPSIKTGIEYDGYKYHVNKLSQDIAKDELCKEKGITIIRIREQRDKTRPLPPLSGISIIYTTQDNKYSILSRTIQQILYDLTGKKYNINIDKDTQDILKMCSNVFQENSLGKQCPDFLNEWSPRNKISPYQISANSTIKVWWKCSKDGYEWQSTPNNRISHNEGCPLCAGSVLIAGVNDAATVNPKILEFWDDNEIKPTELKLFSNKKVKLKCPKCGYEWCEPLKNASARKNICPICSKHHRRPIRATNITTGEIFDFKSITEAESTLNINNMSIYKVLNGKQTSTKGYSFIEL